MSRFRITYHPDLKTAAKTVECERFEFNEHDYMFLGEQRGLIFVVPRDRVLAVAHSPIKAGQFTKDGAE